MSLPVPGWFLSDDRWFAPIPKSLSQENETVKSLLIASSMFSVAFTVIFGLFFLDISKSG